MVGQHIVRHDGPLTALYPCSEGPPPPRHQLKNIMELAAACGSLLLVSATYQQYTVALPALPGPLDDSDRHRVKHEAKHEAKHACAS